VHVIPVPPQTPPLLQTSLYVHAFPSLHVAPVFAVTVHDDVPLHVRVLHVSLVHVMFVPAQTAAAEHTSLYVHALPSLHAAPVAIGFEHTPVAGLHVPAVWH
jgi:hypothetical protein